MLVARRRNRNREAGGASPGAAAARSTRTSSPSPRERRGREQMVTTRPATLAAARGVLDDLESMWRDRLGRFGDVLASHPGADTT